MAKRMNTSRAQLDRLLDPENDKVQLDTLQRAAAAGVCSGTTALLALRTWPITVLPRDAPNDTLYYDVKLRLVFVISGRNELYSTVGNQLMDFRKITIFSRRVVDSYGVPALIRQHFHRWNIGFSVAEEYHSLKRYRPL